VFTLQDPLLEIAARTAVIYVTLLVLLRVTGKRHSGQLTPFDLLLLLLLSNAVQNAMVGPDTSVLGGLIAVATLFTINVAVTWMVRRSGRAAKVLEGTPALLVRHGRILHESLRREGIAEEDIFRALREHGMEDARLVRAAILEVDGTISVLREDKLDPRGSASPGGSEPARRQASP
jgi:uncharacterized membrane protein YcaP (DUF421 family)